VVVPLFWDQYDNAQRVQELGLGRRLSPYTVEPDELAAAIDGLLGDVGLAARLRPIATRLAASPGTEKAASLIERLARERAPITS
jgi:UDP:flavonoid glycosyltransferase YjiC (YdhE family)